LSPFKEEKRKFLLYKTNRPWPMLLVIGLPLGHPCSFLLTFNCEIQYVDDEVLIFFSSIYFNLANVTYNLTNYVINCCIVNDCINCGINNNLTFILGLKHAMQTQKCRSLHIGKTHDQHLEACYSCISSC